VGGEATIVNRGGEGTTELTLSKAKVDPCKALLCSES
jgi:hypothetical protein